MATVSVCIATHKRPDRLREVLDDLARQQRLPQQVVVVDNDAEGSARAVVDALRATAPFRLDYAIQPERNIALTRNRTVELADGEWLAFIDDDERAPPSWLGALMGAVAQYAADGVLAPVEPLLPQGAPGWIRRGRFYDFPRQADGAEVPLNRMRFGNLVLRGERVRAEPGPFDTRYGLMTGEDGDLLVRMVHNGSRIVWFNGAPVHEPVEPRRLSLRWLLLRAYSGGAEFARQTLAGAYRPIGAAGRFAFLARCALQALAGGLLALLSLPTGRHRAAGWLVRAAANVGKLSAASGARYQAYQ